MKELLLTGGSGFIGRNILESFLARDFRICAPTSRELDLADTDCVDAFFKRRSFDAVLHAAVRPTHRNARNVQDAFFSNVRMFENLVRHRGSFGRFIDFGSGAVYGVEADVSGAREEDIGRRVGADSHGFCKYVLHKRMESLEDFVELNIFGIFGKYEDYSIRFISNALCKALCGLPITLRRNRRFSYLFVEDLPEILKRFLNKKPEFLSYNITPDSPVELADLALMAREAAGADVEIKIAAPGMGLDYYGDSSRFRREFGEPPLTPIREAVGKLCEYYRGRLPDIDRKLLLFDK